MEPIQNKQRGRYVYVKYSFVYYLFIYNRNLSDVTNLIQQRMELIPNDPATSDTVTEGTVRCLSRDAYAIALGKKAEYSGRVRGV